MSNAVSAEDADFRAGIDGSTWTHARTGFGPGAGPVTFASDDRTSWPKTVADALSATRG